MYIYMYADTLYTDVYIFEYMGIYVYVYVYKLWLCICPPFPLATVIIHMHASIIPTAWSLCCLQHTRQCVTSDETRPVIIRL